MTTALSFSEVISEHLQSLDLQRLVISFIPFDKDTTMLNQQEIEALYHQKSKEYCLVKPRKIFEQIIWMERILNCSDELGVVLYGMDHIFRKKHHDVLETCDLYHFPLRSELLETIFIDFQLSGHHFCHEGLKKLIMKPTTKLLNSQHILYITDHLKLNWFKVFDDKIQSLDLELVFRKGYGTVVWCILNALIRNYVFSPECTYEAASYIREKLESKNDNFLRAVIQPQHEKFKKLLTFMRKTYFDNDSSKVQAIQNCSVAISKLYIILRAHPVTRRRARGRSRSRSRSRLKR